MRKMSLLRLFMHLKYYFVAKYGIIQYNVIYIDSFQTKEIYEGNFMKGLLTG